MRRCVGSCLFNLDGLFPTFIKKTLKFLISLSEQRWKTVGLNMGVECLSIQFAVVFTEKEDMSPLPQNRKALLSLQMKAGAQ